MTWNQIWEPFAIPFERTMPCVPFGSTPIGEPLVPGEGRMFRFAVVRTRSLIWNPPRGGVAVADAVGVRVGVAVCVRVAVGVLVAVAVGVRVGVAV